MNNNKSLSFFRLLFFPPKQDVINIAVEKRNRFVVLIPIIFGIMIGFFKTVSNYDSANIEYWYGLLVSNIISSILLTLVGVFLYVLLVQFLSSMFKGISNYKMTFTMFSYSLIPVIIGWLLISVISMIMMLYPIKYTNAITLIDVRNIIQRIFMLYGIIILVRGVGIINQFSIIKALISSVGLIILLLIIGFFQQMV